MATFQLTPSESVRVVRHEPEALEVEGTWGPGGSPPPKHFHPAQDERFEVLEGTLHTRVEGQERELPQPLLVPLLAGMGVLGRLKGYRP